MGQLSLHFADLIFREEASFQRFDTPGIIIKNELKFKKDDYLNGLEDTKVLKTLKF